MKHQPIHALRPREPRRKVRIPVRMRARGGWADIYMLDVSSRGRSMQGSDPADCCRSATRCLASGADAQTRSVLFLFLDCGRRSELGRKERDNFL